MKELPLYTFTDKNLEELAFTHRSYGSPHNERLEWLGDSILNCAISRLIYSEFPKINEGSLTAIRTHLVNGQHLATLAKKIGLDKYIRMGKTQHNDISNSIADALEAYIAAVYLDGGDIEKLIHSLFNEPLQLLKQTIQKEGIISLRDAKSRLQEKLQATGQPLPVYQLKKIIKKDNQQLFVMQCLIDSYHAEATKISKNSAEQAAALICLQHLLDNE